MTNFIQYRNVEVDTYIKTVVQLFPQPLSKIEFTNKVYIFLNSDNQDITHLVVAEPDKEGKSLFETVSFKLNNLISNDTPNIYYRYNVPHIRKSLDVFNKISFGVLRGGKGVEKLSNEMDLDRTFIYDLESGVIRNYAVCAILKYMDFFNKPFHFFFKSKIKRQLIETITNEMVYFNEITKEQKEKIIDRVMKDVI